MKLLLIFLLVATTAFAQTPEWSRTYHTGSVTCIDFSSDGKKLLSGGEDHKIRLWDVLRGDSAITFKSIKERIDNVEFNKTDEWFVASWAIPDYEGKCYASVFNIDKDIIAKNIFCRPVIQNAFALINPESFVTFLIENDTNLITVWSGLEFYTPYQNRRSGYISKFSIPNNTQTGITSTGVLHFRCANSTNEKFIINNLLLNTKTGIRTTIPIEKIIAGSFITDDLGLFANEFGTTHILELSSFEKIDSLSDSTSLATALAVDFRNRYYISAHTDTTMRLWTPGIPNVFKRIQLESPVTTIAVSPDSVRFATAHTDGTVAVWNIDSLAYYAQSDTVLTDIAEDNLFKNFMLSAEPNPFKNSTTIRYSLPKPLQIKIAVTDILGKEIAVLKDEFVEMGEQSVVFKNENLPDGMYYITLSGVGLLKTLLVQISR